MKPIDDQILELLRCPVTGSRLSPADPQDLNRLNEQVARGNVEDRSGRKIEIRIDQGLINEDRSLLMPIRGGVISLTADHTISIDDVLGSDPS